MKYEITDKNIIIKDLSDFSPKDIFECGQIFRFKSIDNGYIVFSKNFYCTLIYEKEHVIMTANDRDYFVRFFDLNRDYGSIKQALSGIPNMNNAIIYGKGLRLLNQDPFEMIISFIISANNNIPRIKGIIERMCETSGDYNHEGYYSFPSVEALAKRDVNYFKELGAGYRAQYLEKTTKAIKDGFDLELKGMNTVEARKHLMSLTGIGRKVADCVLLFAYHRTDVFPTDTWISKVFDEMHGKSDLSSDAKSDLLSEKYGNLSGYAQQYLYYYVRSMYNKKYNNVEDNHG